MIENVQTKKKRGRGRHGPNRKTSISETLSSMSEERTQTESDSQVTKSSKKNRSCTVKTVPDKKKPPRAPMLPKTIEVEERRPKSNDACSFPKTSNYQNRDIYVNVKKLTSNVRKIETLTQQEKQELMRLRSIELQKFHE
jgi:hypothetical protein